MSEADIAKRSAAALGHRPPGSYEELRAVLSSGAAHLPRRLREVAAYLWENPSDVALGTTGSLAAAIGTQPSTLVRFAKAFGFAGFTDLQALFKDHVREAPGGAPARGGGLVSGFAKAGRAALDALERDLDGPEAEAAARVLAEAPFVHVIGAKRAFPVAAYAALLLAQARVPSVLMDHVGDSALDQARCLGPAHTVLAISLSPYNSVTPDVVAAVAARGATVLAITDGAASPLAPHAAHRLDVAEGLHAGLRGLTGCMTLVLALVARTEVLREGLDANARRTRCSA